MNDTKSNGPSSPSSTPDSFLYETRYVVLSFLNNLAQATQRESSTSTDSDQRVRLYAQRWKSRSVPCSPPKHTRRKNKSPVVNGKKKQCISDESLHLIQHQNSRNEFIIEKGQEEKKTPLSQRHSYPSNTPSAETSNGVEKTASVPNRIVHYQRSTSTNSSLDGSSYFSDADDELDTSQGSSVGSLQGSMTRDKLKQSGHHLHVNRLPTVPSESEPEGDGNSSRVEIEDMLPIDVNDIHFDVSPEVDEDRQPSVPFSAFLAKDDDEDDTESDVSDIIDEYCGVKGLSDEEGKIGEAAGGSDIPGESDDHGSRSSRKRRPEALFLDLFTTPRQARASNGLNDTLENIREEVQEEMLSLESEVDEAKKSCRVSSDYSPFGLLCPLTPQSEAAQILARIGDEIVDSQMPRVQSAITRLFLEQSDKLTYETFRNVASSIIDGSIPGWRQVALLLVYSQAVALRMAQAGRKGVSNVVDYSVQLLADFAADFIIKQGGWSSVLTTESSSSCLTTPEPSTVTAHPCVLAADAPSSLQTLDTVSLPEQHSNNLHSQPPQEHSNESSPTRSEQHVTLLEGHMNGDMLKSSDQNNTANTSGTPEQSQCNTASATHLERGDHSNQAMSNTVFEGLSLTKVTATLAILSIGLGLAMAYIKR